MSKDTEVDMKEVELNELDQEKLPMTGDSPGTEKNGSVKLKVPDEDVKFTGLSKEELMKVAGTPGWVRTRWALLVLFWLGWLGMLAGAILLIVQAPRCKPIPEMNWWNEGPLYRVSDLDAFTGDKGLQGVSERLDSVGQMKVKGLILGPLHTVQADQVETLDLASIDPSQGTEQDLRSLLDKAHKKGVSVVLDLTPNYLGTNVWFEPDSQVDVLNKLKSASEHWLQMGVDGIQLSDFSVATVTSPEWAGLQDVVQGNRTEEVKNKALIVRAGVIDATAVSQLLNASGADLLLSDMMTTPGEPIKSIQTLLGDHKQSSLAWGLGAGQGKHLGLPGSGLPGSVRLNHLLLLTLPGTPAFMYGDEIGLTQKTMLWDSEETPVEGAAVNKTAEDLRAQRQTCRSWFRSLSDLRGKERSLLHGDYFLLHSSPTSLAFLRSWDQSERYVTAINWGSQPTTLSLGQGAGPPAEGAGLPAEARVRLSSDPEGAAPDASVALDQVVVGAGHGMLLSFPFLG